LRSKVPTDYSNRIKKLRQNFGITQTRLAELLGVSFASINRWENNQSIPNLLAWQKIERAELLGMQSFEENNIHAVREESPVYQVNTQQAPDLDFTSPSEIILTVVEAYRLAFGHQFNPAFATEISLIDPLPHQRVAVYDHMLPQPRLRFLLADDAGAGKTIMAGLYIREMLARRLIHRVLIVPPAGLVANWEKEMRTLFGLHFQIIFGADARVGNPFTGYDSNLTIVSIDTLAGERTFSRLQEPLVEPYDLVIFDEAHKLSADREPDFRVRKTDRYRLAEALSGANIEQNDPDGRWKLSWMAQHLILLTATPHMGKDYPYYCLWRLLEPEALSTFDAFSMYPADARAHHFIRRTKEEMVRFDGTPIYPTRISDTLSYELSQGNISEQELYDQATAYIEYYYNRARILNRSAARLAMSIFQRRLASSTYAMICSLERRLERLRSLMDDIRSGKISPQQLQARQRKLDSEVHDELNETTADEEGVPPEGSPDGKEEHEISEEQALGGVVGTSLAELEAESQQVKQLLDLAHKVYEEGHESKFEKLLEVLRDPEFKDEKLIIFTEHRDTLNFLVRRMEGMGYTGQIVQIHGGMDYHQRENAVDAFRKPLEEGGAKYLIATDAAGEGINLQVCWLMVNYDIPWNPARLEQRMGRIHRYGQKHDPVFIINLVAGKTREGKVMYILLDKLERIRKELHSDKVFDVVGRLFENVSLRAYFEQATTEEGALRAEKAIEGQLTTQQVKAIQEREQRLFGDGGDIKSLLPRLQKDLEMETYRRLLPGYVRNFCEHAFPLLDLGVVGDLSDVFSLRPLKPGALDSLWPLLESYPPEQRIGFTFNRPSIDTPTIFLHPGEPFFDHLMGIVTTQFAQQANTGGVFVDPTIVAPYIFHLAEISLVRKADLNLPALAQEETIETRLVALREEANGQIQPCPIESLLLLRGVNNIPPHSLSLASTACSRLPGIEEYLQSLMIQPQIDQHQQQLRSTLSERESFKKRGYAYQEAELATARTRFTEKANAGDPNAKGELTRIKERQRLIAAQREQALLTLRREPELISAGTVTLLAHAIIVPTSDPEEMKRRDDRIEAIAMQVAIAFEEANGATVKDVHTPEFSHTVGLGDYPGFDLFSRYPDGNERAIEVKGKAQVGDIIITDNEWAAACNLRQKYWLYVVYDCATSSPNLLRVNDPWIRLVAKSRDFTIPKEEIQQNTEG
jgi:superfamily II DNA or RNA helicase/DNA-binding XRE family transcriptional regulator